MNIDTNNSSISSHKEIQITFSVDFIARVLDKFWRHEVQYYPFTSVDDLGIRIGQCASKAVVRLENKG